MHVGATLVIVSIRSPSLLAGFYRLCTRYNWLVIVQTKFVYENNVDTRIFSLSCNFLFSTVWANPQFCPDTRSGLYWPCVIMKIHNAATFPTFSHAAHLALFLSCNNGNSNRVPLKTSLSNVPRYNVGI